MVSDDALYSPDWFRVSKLVLRLKPTVRIGRQPVQTLWNRLFAEAGDAVPSQHEIVDLVQQLADAGLGARADHGRVAAARTVQREDPGDEHAARPAA
ncbi:MAG: hypothetical protein ACK5PW_22255 [Burkholderiales bacterium]|jgi:hypothetical protein